MLAGWQRGRRGTQRRFPTSRSGDRSRRLVSKTRQSLNKILVVDNGGTHVKLPLELGDLPYRDPDIIENFLGIPGIERLGEDEWKREVIFAVAQLKKSFIADYVVLGGGNVHRFDQLPEGIERGKNENAFVGGVRLWETGAAGERKWRIF